MGPSRDRFTDFQSLDANYVYCPNQFFDVCLSNCSRGAVRIVAYVLRQTLGWLDEHGRPVCQNVRVSYRDLVDQAGVSRGAIGPALREVVDARFVECCTEGRASQRGVPPRSAEYRLRWGTDTAYTKSLSNFEGFFTGEGHRTPIPNSFFDDIMPNERLAVVKVVGAVLRHTVGYQNQFGGRRSAAPLSYSYLQRYTNVGSRSKLSAAIEDAKRAGYIKLVSAGSFHADIEKRSAATYAIRWQNEAESDAVGSKREPVSHRFKKGTRSSSKRGPADRFKKGTDQKTSSNQNNKRNDVVADSLRDLKQLLVDQGVDAPTAERLSRDFDQQVVERQVAWIDARHPTENRVGMLIKAITEDWSKPAEVERQERDQARRQRDRERDQLAAHDDQEVASTKAARQDRKLLLLAEWGRANREDRERLIREAALAESSRMLADIIRKHDAATKSPHVHVLDRLAAELGMPAVTEVETRR